MKTTTAFDSGKTITETFPASGAPARTLLQIKTILAPVDFSECSRKALQYAVAFARQFGATVLVLNVVEPYVPVPEMSTVDWELIQRRMREGAETELAKLKDSLSDVVQVDTRLRVGRPEREIVEAAKEWNIDLIIISTHGRTGLAHVFMGSTAERIVRHAPCPTLIVREREHDFVSAAV